MSPAAVDATVAAVTVGSWLAFYAVCALVTRPRTPAPRPPTPDLGAEPPALASLLVSGWKVTDEAAQATLLDLAARGHLELRQPGDDPRQTTLHVRDPDPGDLHAYEAHVLRRVTGLAAGGVLPATALTLRDRRAARRWRAKFRDSVTAHARGLGLTRKRLEGAALALITAALVPAAALAVVAARLAGRSPAVPDDVRVPVFTALVTFLGLLGLVAVLAGRERDTAAGRAAAARWLGVRAWLRGHDEFASLPPAAVAVWDRYLAYGAALGVTRLAGTVLRLGLGDRRLVWSSHGGTWHRVRVRYPHLRPHLGRTTWHHARSCLFTAVLAAAMLWDFRTWLRGAESAGWFLVLEHLAGALFLLGAGRGVGGSTALRVTLGAVVAWGLLAGPPDALFIPVWVVLAALMLGAVVYTLVRAVTDRLAPRQVTGEVLWAQVWRRKPPPPLRLLGFSSKPVLYYLAVDDGAADRTTAWALPAALQDRCADGDTVTFTARRWSRRVLDLTVVGHGRATTTAADPASGPAPQRR